MQFIFGGNIMSEQAESIVDNAANTDSVVFSEEQTDTSVPTQGVPGALNGDDATKPPEKRKRKSTLRLFIELCVKLTVIAASVWVLLTFIVSLNIHYGNNMFPSIKDGDLVVGYRLQRPYLNGAVVYELDGKVCIGRVVGMAGNEIDIAENGAITVNGIAPAEEVFYPTYPAEGSPIDFPVTVEEGRVFILNDFRSDTNDSRTFGTVDLEDVIGSVLLIIRRRGF